MNEPKITKTDFIYFLKLPRRLNRVRYLKLFSLWFFILLTSAFLSTKHIYDLLDNICVIIFYLCLLMIFLLAARRLNDCNQSALWLIPFGALPLFWLTLLFWPGTKGPNTYGNSNSTAHGMLNSLVPNNPFNYKKIIFIWSNQRWRVILGIFIAVCIVVLTSNYTKTQSTVQTSDNASLNHLHQEKIASSVVNIICKSDIPDEPDTGGSGTIITDSGIILTNAHIIPHGIKNEYADKTNCIVLIADPVTGRPKTAYLAKPLIVPILSDEYDLAYLQIYDAYYSTKNQTHVGKYPRKFPKFDFKDECKNKDVRLGEPIQIFGYPSLSGGKSLTITEGIISSFPSNGIIITSAKVSPGNSGGLAVSSDGCMIGVPSRIRSDDSESLGIIISKESIDQFLIDLENILEIAK